MAILHGSWLLHQGGYLFIWGETWRRIAASDAPQPDQFIHNPYGMAAAELNNFLSSLQQSKQLNWQFPVDEKQKVTAKGTQQQKKVKSNSSQKSQSPETTTQKSSERWQKHAIALPTHIGAVQENLIPLHSSAINLDTTEIDSLYLYPWQVEGFCLKPLEAFAFLQALPLGADADSFVGADLRFWSHISRWSLDLLARGKFLPALEKSNSNIRAIWQPLLDSATDRIRLANFATQMPTVCRTYQVQNQLPQSIDLPPTPQELLKGFLSSAIDAQVRTAQSTALEIEGIKPLSEWLKALKRESNTLELEPDALERLKVAIAAWKAPLQHLAAQNQFRTGFHLIPPPSGKKDWTLNYCLQAVDDPEFLVDATTIWNHPVQRFTYRGRTIDSPQETLLSGLGLASKLYPLIEPSLQQQSPQSCQLNPLQAYEFIKSVGWRFSDSGLGVILPPSLANREGWASRLGLSIQAETSLPLKNGDNRIGLQSLLNFKWKLTIGGQQISQAEFDRLVALNSPLVEINGEWVELRLPDVKAAQAFFASRKDQMTLSLEDALRLASGDTQTIEKLPVVNFKATGQLQELLNTLNNNESINAIAPKSLQGELRPYQARGVGWLSFLERWGLGACLADDMGMGKCILPQSLIFLNGFLETAETIWETYSGKIEFDGEGFWTEPQNQLLVNSIDENTSKIVEAPIRRLYRQRVQEQLRKITLKDGNSITITRRHKLLTRDGWTKDLNVGDYVGVPAKLAWKGQPVDPDLIKFIAWQIVEGYEANISGSLTIAQKDQKQLKELLHTLVNIGERYKLKINNPTIQHPHEKVPFLRLNSQAYRRFLEAKGYQWGQRSCDKSIPPFVMQADIDSVRIFLRNYFDAEACVIIKTQSIEISTASPLLLQQISTLLRRFGIWLQIGSIEKSATNDTGILDTYYIGVLVDSSANLFLQEIGFNHLDKQRKLEQICEPKLQVILEREVFYSQIDKIEESEYEGWVYDFEVSEHHNFIANNILCHNTIQLIAFLLHLQEQESLKAPTLLVCPTSVLGNWEREVKKFAPTLKILLHYGDKRHKNKAFAAAIKGKDLIITSYPLVYRDGKELHSIKWQGVVLDEAQNIKNSEAKQSQAVRQIQASFKIALTGTPVENRLQELWSILDFLNPGFLGPRNFFQRRFAVPIEKYGDRESLQTLRSLVQPFILRRLKTDKTIIQDLPEKQEMTVFCPLSTDQATLYQKVVEDSLVAIESTDGIQRRGMILALLVKLKQICNHPSLGKEKEKAQELEIKSQESGKLQRLDEMLEEVLSEGDRALIFTQFAEWGHLLKPHLEKQLSREILFLYGGTRQQQREEMIDRFQHDPQGPPIMILSLKAGGTGLNLTRATHVFHYDRWWNPAVENQATDRVFRIGQTRNVQVHKFVCTGTLEEKIHDMIESKKALAEQVVGGGENWLTELDTDQLRNLLILDRNAIIEEDEE